MFMIFNKLLSIFGIMKGLFVIILGLIVLQSCNDDDTSIEELSPIVIDDENIEITTDFEAIFKEVDSLSLFKNTDFVTTLESPIDKNKNSIYAATMLFAWDEIRKEIKDSIINIESNELELMNNSKSYIGVLDKDEYKTSIEVSDDLITAKAHFKKSLPFSYPFKKFETPIIFKNDSVEMFGFYGESSKAHINFYNTDNDFSITLKPKDRSHEIILIKTNEKQKSLSKYLEYYNTESLAFKNNLNSDNKWQHEFIRGDRVKIPVINFNIEHNYENIQGSKFNTTEIIYKVLSFYQHNAFILNEKGAEVESYSFEGVVESSAEAGVVRPQPKHLIFNDDFVIFLKRKDADFPYFGLYITNDELMVKFNN